MRLRAAAAVLLLLSGGSACAVSEETRRPPAPPEAPPAPAHEALHAVLWTQTAAEYRAAAHQAYQAARRMLHEALSDTTWTAILEQAALGAYGTLPPAVVLDVDETVLDNAPYQAWLIKSNMEYPAGWGAWIEARQAGAIPGALAFTRHADSLGVAVLYLTNRRHHQEAATRDNLARLGFPLRPGEDVLFTRGEREEWATGDKGSRRRAIAERYRILLLVGDNLGDFLSGGDTTVSARREHADRYAGFWGTRWIVLPNPLYGSWEGALFDYEYGLDPPDKLRRKYDALNVPSLE